MALTHHLPLLLILVPLLLGLLLILHRLRLVLQLLRAAGTEKGERDEAHIWMLQIRPLSMESRQQTLQRQQLQQDQTVPQQQLPLPLQLLASWCCRAKQQVHAAAATNKEGSQHQKGNCGQRTSAAD